MRLGLVGIRLTYTVDLDDKEMVERAKSCLYEDLLNANKYNELWEWIDSYEDQGLCKDDIPEFLLEDLEEED